MSKPAKKGSQRPTPGKRGKQDVAKRAGKKASKSRKVLSREHAAEARAAVDTEFQSIQAVKKEWPLRAPPPVSEQNVHELAGILGGL